MHGPNKASISWGSEPNSSFIVRMVAGTTPASVPFLPLCTIPITPVFPQ